MTIGPDGVAYYPWNHGDPLTASALNAAIANAGAIASDAPSDGGTYGRLNAAWTQVLPLTGGTLSGSLTLVSLTMAAGPTIRAGTGAATGTQPAGSLWLRTDGTAGARLYVSAGGGAWAAVAGV